MSCALSVWGRATLVSQTKKQQSLVQPSKIAQRIFWNAQGNFLENGRISTIYHTHAHSNPPSLTTVLFDTRCDEHQSPNHSLLHHYIGRQDALCARRRERPFARTQSQIVG
eukprot:c5612_g1_i4.p2 GENE.c5612_g1_i4~~c5612_g1_i4.p2  ORF type:complete len:111 (-),score=6.26 c5612_g1_i4:255-587(-)